MSELIQPNLHVALVHFPIALICVGVATELLSFLGWQHGWARLAARWMILLGAVLGMPAVTSGIYALADLREFIAAEDVVPIRRHLLLTAGAVLGTLLACSVWIGSGDEWRRKLYLPLALLMLLAAGAIVAGSHIGGRLVYERGLGVKQPGMDEASGQGLRLRITAALPPTQTHVILAGLAFALAILAPGIASQSMLRRASGGNPFEAHTSGADAAPHAEPPDPTPLRFAAAATAVTLLTGLAGVWIMAGDDWNLREVWRQVADRSMNEGRWLTRLMAHLLAGLAILLLPALTMSCSRWAPRARVLWMILTTLLALAIAAQVWLGVLLLFDGSMGSLTRWNPP